VTIRRIAFVALGMLVMVTVQPSAGDARLQTIMRTKLSNTQVLLKAIVTTDYGEIDRAAAALSRISEAEIVSWQSPPRAEYTDQAMLFMTSVTEIRAAAKRHDIQAVGDEYSTLVSTCIRCHTYVRDARLAALPSHLAPLN
jgi:cytochrome c553